MKKQYRTENRLSRLVKSDSIGRHRIKEDIRIWGSFIDVPDKYHSMPVIHMRPLAEEDGN